MIIFPWIVLPAVLAGYAISSFVIAQTSAVGADVGAIGGAVNLLMGLGGVLGVLGFLVGLPVGIYLVTRKETDWLAALRQQPRFHGMSDESLHFVAGWSWGAFFSPMVWALGNKQWLWFLGCFVPLWNVYVWLRLAADGRQIAWERSTEHIGAFRTRQRIIAWVIVVLFVLGLVSSAMDASKPRVSRTAVTTSPASTLVGVPLGKNPVACDRYEDADGDGLANGQEADFGTDPAKTDSDADGYSDFEELSGGYNPNDAVVLSDADGDGLADAWERDFYGSDRNAPDSDGDGVSDIDEVRAGQDPGGEGTMERVLRLFDLRMSVARSDCGE